MIEQEGAEEAAMMFENLAANAEFIPTVLDEAAEEITQRSRQIATSKGLYRTGKGVEGIDWSQSGWGGRVVGWQSRPRLHLLFHEIGTYKDPPRPHIRPAARSYEGTLATNIRNTLFKI